MTHTHLSSEVGGSNRNLLDNWYFPAPVNQRGQNTYTSGGTIDRWVVYNSPTVTLSDEGVHFIGPSGANSGFQQPIENPTQYNGCTMTFSALVKGKGTLIVNNPGSTGTVNMMGAGFNSDAYTLVTKTFLWRVTHPDGYVNALLWSNGSNPADFYAKAAKLELGSVQTLARQENGAWVLNDPPPNPQQELAKCQRYQVMLANGRSQFITWCNAVSSTTALAYLYLPTPLRAKPTLTINNCMLLAIDASADADKIPVDGIGEINLSGNIVRLQLICSGGLVAGKAYQFYISYNMAGSLLLDANL